MKQSHNITNTCLVGIQGNNNNIDLMASFFLYKILRVFGNQQSSRPDIFFFCECE